MRSNNHSNTLLVELLIVVLFFMLASTVLLRVFAAARSQSAQAEDIAAAVAEAQNVADRLYAAAEGEACLRDLGFTEQDALWTRKDGSYSLEITLSEEERGPGRYLSRLLVVRDADGNEWLRLPCSRYVEVSP